MILAKYTKQPSERKRYVLDYSDWLDSGETISTAVFSVDPVGGLIVDASSIGTPATTVAYFVSSGTTAVQYTVTVTISTSGGQIKEDEVLYHVKAV